jgi:hypothetical protein
MYWNNPLIELNWPSTLDPIQQSFHNGTHCIFWNPNAKFDHITTNQRLGDLCKWANECLITDGIDGFIADNRNHYDIANLVKLNMWIKDIREQGIVKPWLIQDQGNGTYLAGTGDSRLRALECIPEIQTVPAFISTSTDRADLYADLEPVTSFDQFATLCGAERGNLFLFRLTDATAPYGMYWYEYNTSRTRAVTPGEKEAVNMFVKYIQQYPNTVITHNWFNTPIEWAEVCRSSS